MTYTRMDAIRSLRPEAKWGYEDGKGFVIWEGPGTQPTEDELTAEINRLDTVYANEKYKRDRAAEYPSVVDQLDDIYHNGIDAWKATIKTTKDKYPKP